MINPVVADLLCIRTLHPRQLFTNHSFFYHPVINNCMSDDASCLFKISDISLLAHMSATYPQPQSLWQISFLPPDLLSCVIFILCKKPCERALLKKFDRRSSTSSGMTSAPPCQSKLLSKIHPSLASISSKYMGTESVTPSTPNAKWSDLGRSRFLRHGG